MCLVALDSPSLLDLAFVSSAEHPASIINVLRNLTRAMQLSRVYLQLMYPTTCTVLCHSAGPTLRMMSPGCMFLPIVWTICSICQLHKILYSLRTETMAFVIRPLCIYRRLGSHAASPLATMKGKARLPRPIQFILVLSSRQVSIFQGVCFPYRTCTAVLLALAMAAAAQGTVDNSKLSPLRFREDGTFHISVFSDLHMGMCKSILSPVTFFASFAF